MGGTQRFHRGENRSIPGLLLQKLTTKEPDDKQLEVAIAAMKAVLVPTDTPVYVGDCDKDGSLIQEEKEEKGISAVQEQEVLEN